MNAIIAIIGLALLVGSASASIHVGDINVYTSGLDLKNSMSDLGVRAVETYETSALEVYSKTGIPLSEIIIGNTIGSNLTKVGQLDSGYTLYEAEYVGYAAITEYPGMTVVISGDTLEDVIYTLDRTRVDKNAQPSGRDVIYQGSKQQEAEMAELAIALNGV